MPYSVMRHTPFAVISRRTSVVVEEKAIELVEFSLVGPSSAPETGL